METHNKLGDYKILKDLGSGYSTKLLLYIKNNIYIF
jgi:hypothetical protein